VTLTADTITDEQIAQCEPSEYECPTCLGNRRIRDGETGILRRCLDCGGSGQRADARARCVEILNARKLTAATITDEQIRELRRDNPDDRRVQKACRAALGESRGGGMAERNARVRCAEILNARTK